MKIIDRYLISHFIKPLGACAAVFAILVLIGRFFDKMEIFNNFHAKAHDIIFFLILGLPYWLNLVFPVATLLALMFSLGQLQQRGEITAMRSAGVSSIRLYAPFLTMGLLISLVSLIGGLTVLPSLTSRSMLIYRQNIKQQPPSTQRDHIVATGRNHQRFTIGWLDTKTAGVHDIVVDQFDDQGHLLSTLSAQEGHYANGQWTFERGTWIHFDTMGGFLQEPFQTKALDIPEKPEDFIYEDRKVDDMTQLEIRRRVRRLRDLGIPTFKEQVALHFKYALPFGNLVVILLGIPFALGGSLHKGRVQTIAYALGATFLYWGTVSVCQSFGEQGHVPAWVSAWTANFIYGSLAVWMLRRMNRV